MKNVYGYIRVSTAKQGEGVSLSVQKDAIIQYAKQFNLNISEWFEELETAAKQGRPIFNELMKLLKSKKADGVIMHKIDRSARHLQDWVDIGNLIDQGIEVHFAHENLDLQARGGRLSADIQAVIAADYIRNLRQEAIKGIYGRLKQGIYPFQAPPGYLNNGAGKYKTIDPVQGPFIRKAFELYATKKYTVRTLARELQALGLKNTRNKKVNINTLSCILNNPFYIGILEVKGVSFNGGHEPLITTDLFKRVQAILRGNTNQKTQRHEFKFKKLLKCKGCGYSLIAETQKGHTYYRCHTKNCVTKGIREITIENMLLKELRGVQLQQEEAIILEDLLQEAKNGWLTKQGELLNSIKFDAGKVSQKLERLTDCYVEGGLDKETFESRKRELLLESKIKETEQKELLTCKAQIFKKVEKFLERAKSLMASYELGNLDEQRELVEMVTSNFVVEGKNLIISMRSPFQELRDRSFLTFGGLSRSASRKMHPEFVDSDDALPPAPPPLTEEELRHLLDLIISVVSQLPDDDTISRI